MLHLRVVNTLRPPILVIKDVILFLVPFGLAAITKRNNQFAWRIDLTDEVVFAHIVESGRRKFFFTAVGSQKIRTDGLECFPLIIGRQEELGNTLLANRAEEVSRELEVGCLRKGSEQLSDALQALRLTLPPDLPAGLSG